MNFCFFPGLPLLVYQWMIKPKGRKLCLPKNEIYFCTKLLKNEKVKKLYP